MTQYLRCRRGRYLVQIRVPLELKDRYPAQFVERYLGTSDKREANDKAPATVATIKAEFKAKREGTNANVVTSAMSHAFDSFRASAFQAIAEGEATAGTLRDSEVDVAAVLKHYGIEANDNLIGAFAILIAGGRSAGISRIENRAGPPPDPKPWRRPATSGETVESAVYLEEYLATLSTRDRPAKPKSIDMRRSAIKKFCAEFPSLADVKRQDVQRWINDQTKAGLSASTIGRNVSDVRNYWRYLRSIQKVADEPDPFDSAKLTLPSSGKNGKLDDRKPFSPSDVRRLIAEARKRDDGELADLIELGMWTGARREELCALKIEKVNLRESYFDVEDAKTAAGWRQVPIHPKLLPTMRRLVDKRTTGYVFSDLSANKYQNRGNAIGKRFSSMKTAMGFGEQFVFHSTRKTVATLLENAGVLENVAADILGHEKPRITYGLYSGGTSLAMKRAAIEQLRYPQKA